MIATKTLLLMVMGLVRRENGEMAKIAESWLEVLVRVLARFTGILKNCNLLLAESCLRFFSILAEVMNTFSRKYSIYGLTADKNYLFFAHSGFG